MASKDTAVQRLKEILQKDRQATREANSAPTGHSPTLVGAPVHRQA